MDSSEFNGKGSIENPWLEIPLSDYEGHMSEPSVAQASLLADTLGRLVETYRPRSLALLGSAGGNGLDRVNRLVTRRVVAVDVNPSYLETCRNRYGKQFDTFEQIACDLSAGQPFEEPVDFVYAALILEYLDVYSFLDYVPSLVTSNGRIAFVFQGRSAESAVTPTGFDSLLTLERIHTFADVGQIVHSLSERGMKVELQQSNLTTPFKRFTLLVMIKS